MPVVALAPSVLAIKLMITSFPEFDSPRVHLPESFTCSRSCQVCPFGAHRDGTLPWDCYLYGLILKWSQVKVKLGDYLLLKTQAAFSSFGS